jgi:hypothetical protein
MRLHYKVAEGKTIQCVDMIYLYLYICKYFKFPIGHPAIHFGNDCLDIDAMIHKDGLMKCTILPPKHLFHPILPFRCNNRLLFSLCRSSSIQKNRTEDCTHETDAERALTGTWVLDEIRLAVQHGYKLVEVHGVYEYHVSRYDPQRGNGGLFAEYINTFLKIKAEAIPEDEDRYISEFQE